MKKDLLYVILGLEIVIITIEFGVIIACSMI